MDSLSSQMGRLKEEGNEIKKEIHEHTLGYIVAALGLVAGLAWNEAVKSLIEYFFSARGLGRAFTEIRLRRFGDLDCGDCGRLPRETYAEELDGVCF